MGRARRLWSIATAVGAVGVLAAALGAVERGSADVQESRPLCLGKRATIVGSWRSDTLDGTGGADVIVALGGSDSILAMGGDDRVCGGRGDDEIYADGSFLPNPGRADMVDGGPGKDLCEDAERVVRCEETRPDLPHLSGRLRPGSYVTERFRPRVGFTLGTGWSMPFVPLYTQLLLSQKADPRGLNLRFDSFSDRRSVAATIARFRGIRGVQAGTPSLARIGGAKGQTVELHVKGADFVTVPGLTEAYELERNDKVRAYAVNVRGTTVSVFVEAPASDFPRFAAVARRVLASVRWG
jgi:hypothetical protein